MRGGRRKGGMERGRDHKDQAECHRPSLLPLFSQTRVFPSTAKEHQLQPPLPPVQASYGSQCPQPMVSLSPSSLCPAPTSEDITFSTTVQELPEDQVGCLWTFSTLSVPKPQSWGLSLRLQQNLSCSLPSPLPKYPVDVTDHCLQPKPTCHQHPQAFPVNTPVKQVSK